MINKKSDGAAETLINGVGKIGQGAMTATMFTAPVIGAAIGYVLSRATSPTSTVENADPRIVSAGLDAELEATRRKNAVAAQRIKTPATKPKHDMYIS